MSSTLNGLSATAKPAIQFVAATSALSLIWLPAFPQAKLDRRGSLAGQCDSVIPGATVMVTDVPSGISRTLTTDSAGVYFATSLLAVDLILQTGEPIAGVSQHAGWGAWIQSAHGVLPDTNGWLLDGPLNADPSNGRSVVGAPPSRMRRPSSQPMPSRITQVSPKAPKAEIGCKPGAIVNVGTKSGANTLHGASYTFAREGSWDARSQSARSELVSKTGLQRKHTKTLAGCVIDERLSVHTTKQRGEIHERGV